MSRVKNYGNGIIKGMIVTIKHLFRKPITTQYPEEKLNVSRRIRGNTIAWDKDKCRGCRICEQACPTSCFEITPVPNSGKNEEETKSEETDIKEENPVKKPKQALTIHYDGGLCIYCGLCVETCPFDALHMGYTYEKSSYKIEEQQLHEEDLLAHKAVKISAYARPAIEDSLPKQTLLLDRQEFYIHEKENED